MTVASSATEFNKQDPDRRSVARSSVTVGSDSVAGGIVAINSGTVSHARAGGAVSGDHDSVVGGLAGINDITGLIKYSLAWGSATDTGENTVVAAGSSA